MADGTEIRMRFSSAGLKQARDDLKAFGQEGSIAFAKIDAAVSKPNKALLTTLSELQQVRAAMSAAGNDGTAAFQRIDAAIRTLDPNSMVRLIERGQQLRETLNPAIASERQFGAAVGEASRLLAAGTITHGEYTAAVAMARKEFGVAEKAALGLGAGYVLTSAQGMELAHSARAIVDGLVAGQNPVRMLAMEGGRLGQVMGEGRGGLGGAFTALRGLILGPIGAIAAFVAAIGTAVFAEQRFENSERELERTMLGAGRAAGVSAAQMVALAEGAAKAGNVSNAQARSIANSLLSTGNIAASVIPKVIAGTRDFSAAMGIDAKKGAEELGKALADPAKGADDLNAKLHFLSDATRQQIRDLAESGNYAQAQALMMDKIADATGGAADHLNGFTVVLHALSKGFSDAFDWSGKLIYNLAHMPDAQRLGDLSAKIGQMQGASSLEPAQRTLLAELLKQRDALQKTVDAVNNAPTNKITNEAGDAVRALNPDIEAVHKLRDQLELLQKAQASGWKGMAPDVVKAGTRDLIALTRAIETYVPERVKAQKIAEMDAQIAARPGSAIRDQLMQQRERASLAGEVLTPDEVEARVGAAGERGFNRGARTDHAAEQRAAAAEREWTEAKAAGIKVDENVVRAEENIARWRKDGAKITQAEAQAYIASARAKDDLATRKAADEAAKSDREWQAALSGVTHEQRNLEHALELVAKRTEEGKTPTQAEIDRLVALANAADRAAEASKALSGARAAVKDASTDVTASQGPATDRDGKYDPMAAMTQWANAKVAIEAQAQARIRAAEQARVDAGEESAEQGAENTARAIQAIDAAYALQNAEELLAIRKKTSEEAVRFEEQQQQQLNASISRAAGDFGNAIMKLTTPGARLGTVGQDLARQLLEQILQTLVEDPIVNLIKQALQNLVSGSNLSGGGVTGLLGMGLKTLLGGFLPSASSFSSALGPDISVASNSVAPMSLDTTLPSLSIPGFAAGTNSTPDGLRWVGETGPELEWGSGRSVLSTKNSLSMMADLQRQAFGAGTSQGGSGDLHLHYAPLNQLNAPGADPAALKRLQDLIHANIRAEPVRVAAYLRAAKLR